MRRIHITHSTVFTYTAPITETVMEVRLRPFDGAGQRCVEFDLQIAPESRLNSYVDGFGNQVHHFNHMAPHERVRVVSRSLVETGLPPGPPAGVEDEAGADLLLFRPPVSGSPALRRFAARFGTVDPADAGSVEAALDAVTGALHREFEYNQSATDVHTDTEQFLRVRAGVCQDFAHLVVGIARCLEIPARYVSGYVQDGDRDRDGASHAWAQAWVPGRGWTGWDPTHPLRTGDRHVRVAVGRDYRDAAPTRGVYVGRGRGAMEVGVRIGPA